MSRLLEWSSNGPKSADGDLRRKPTANLREGIMPSNEGAMFQFEEHWTRAQKLRSLELVVVAVTR